MIKKFEKTKLCGAIQPYLLENEPDELSTAFWLCFSLFDNDFTVRSISLNPNGAMGTFFSILRKMGISAVKGFSGTKLIRSEDLSCEIELKRENIDLLALLCIIAASGNEICSFYFENTSEEEAEYISETLEKASELAKALEMDYIYFPDDRLIIKGSKLPLRGGIVDTRADYRFVLAAILASAKSTEQVVVSHCEFVSRVYPELFSDLDRLSE